MNHKAFTPSLLAGVGLALGLVLFRGLPLSADQEPLQPEPGTVVVVAGTGQFGFSGDHGPAMQAQLNTPMGLAVDALGNLYIADLGNNRVRRVGVDGMITTVAGTGQGGSSGDNGPAINARVHGPDFVAFDPAGNLFIAEDFTHRVRKVSSDRIITTLAGIGKAGFSGDGGPATQAGLTFPHGLAFDPAGNLFIADMYAHRVRKVSPDGTITTAAGTGKPGSDGDGGLATQAKLNLPNGLATDTVGNLYIAESGQLFGARYGSRVRKVSSDGIITTVAGTGTSGFSGDHGPATEAQLNAPFGLAVDSAGNLFISDLGNYRVRKVSPDGIITTIAGIGKARPSEAGGAATSVVLRGPAGIAVDAAGNLYIANSSFFVNDGLPERHWIFKVFGVAAPGLIGGRPFAQSKP